MSGDPIIGVEETTILVKVYGQPQIVPAQSFRWSTPLRTSRTWEAAAFVPPNPPPGRGVEVRAFGATRVEALKALVEEARRVWEFAIEEEERGRRPR